MIDAGRLMTSRIEHLSKLDHAINAALAIGYVATSNGSGQFVLNLENDEKKYSIINTPDFLMYC